MCSFMDKVVYQIYPKSFCDTNGDGVGDIAGITKRLDYIKALGADYIWITPFFVSPQRDNGYDVADYCAIDPLFGSMEDFEMLVEAAKSRGLGLMLDMVFNHTSTEHVWLQKALAGDARYEDYYIMRDNNPDTPPTNWQSKFGGSAWEYLPSIKKWYLHLFDRTQADLNWENPAVREELKEVVRFWKKKGVEGFRFDVINLISKPRLLEDDNNGDGRRFYTDGAHVHAFLKELVRDTCISDSITVGELSSTTLEEAVRYCSPNEQELSMCFMFHHLKVDYEGSNKWVLNAPDFSALKEILGNCQQAMQESGCTAALFWSNHDQTRVASRFGNDKEYWRESATMLATAMYLLRGTPYIYQGEELGMKNANFTDISSYRDVESRNYYDILLRDGKSKAQALEIVALRSRDNSRTPVLWDDTAHAGFSEQVPWIEIPTYRSEQTAACQQRDEGSVLSYYQKLFAFRRQSKEAVGGNIRFLQQPSKFVWAYERTTKAGRMVVLCNLGADHQTASEDLDTNGLSVVLHNYKLPPEIAPSVVLRPYEAVVLEEVY